MPPSVDDLDKKIASVHEELRRREGIDDKDAWLRQPDLLHLAANLYVTRQHTLPALPTPNDTYTKTKPRLVCLVNPIGCTEQELFQYNGSIEIIAREQLTLMRFFISNYNIVLYNADIEPRADDILIILTCLPLAPHDILNKFNRKVLFFDDLTVHRLTHEEYQSRLETVDIILHPVQETVRQLAKQAGRPVFYVPWSIARLPSPLPAKTQVPSFFVDMDRRESVIDSIDSAVEFIELARQLPAEIFVPSLYMPQIPSHLHQHITFVPHLPHDQFLNFLGKTWFYVSGIRGSYEYCVLESAFLGCGLISLRSALSQEHVRRRCFIDYAGQPDILSLLQSLVDHFRPAEICADAGKLYPADASKLISSIIAKELGDDQSRKAGGGDFSSRQAIVAS